MNRPLKIALGIFAVLAIFCAGIMTGRHWPLAPDEPRYRATTRFQIIGPEVLDVSSMNRSDMRMGNWFETQAKVISSPSTTSLAAKNLKLETKWKRSPEDAAKTLAGMIKVEQEPNANVVSLSAWSDNAEEAAAIANGVRDAYEQQRREAQAERLRRLNENVSNQIKLQEATVEKSRQEMLDLMKKHNIVDLVPLSSGARPQPADVPAVANLPGSGEIEETSKAASETNPAAVGTERQKHSEYATKKYRYESQVLLLNSIREHAQRRADEPASRDLIEILEPAVAIEDP